MEQQRKCRPDEQGNNFERAKTNAPGFWNKNPLQYYT